MKRILIATVVILLTLAAVLLVWELRIAVVLFLLSLVVTAAVRPITGYWERRGWSRIWAILVTYGVGLALVLALALLIGRPLLNDMAEGTDAFTQAYETAVETWPEGTAFEQMVAERLPPPEDLYAAIAGERGTMLMRTALGMAQGLFSFLGQAFVVLTLSVYWSADRVRFERLWLTLLPANQRGRARDIWRAVENGVGEYIRSELVQSLVAGLLLGLGYWLMGLEYPVLLAFLGALLLLIPWLGVVLSVILPFLIGLQHSLLLGAGAVIYTLAIMLMLEFVVEPRFFKRREYSSLLIVVIVVAMAEAFGLLGIVLAPPLAAALQILGRKLMQPGRPAMTREPVEQVAQLRQRLENLRATLSERPEAPPPEVQSLMERLDGLVGDACEYFQVNEDQEAPHLDLPAAKGGPVG